MSHITNEECLILVNLIPKQYLFITSMKLTQEYSHDETIFAPT